MSERVAIVTGAGQGIGRGVAERLGADGLRVVVAEVNRTTGEESASAIVNAGGTAFFQHTDVTDETSVAALIDATLARYGRIDVLVNNVGGSVNIPISEITASKWREIVDVNLTGTFLCAQRARPYLRQQPNASIVNVASLHAFHTVPGMAAYAAAKGGILSLTRSLALEYAPTVRVNVIIPGLIETEAWFQAVQDVEKARKHRLGFHPLGRLGKPEDVAGVVAFLTGPDAAFLTGVALPVDGGMTLQLYRSGADE